MENKQRLKYDFKCKGIQWKGNPEQKSTKPAEPRSTQKHVSNACGEKKTSRGLFCSNCSKHWLYLQYKIFHTSSESCGDRIGRSASAFLCGP